MSFPFLLRFQLSVDSFPRPIDRDFRVVLEPFFPLRMCACSLQNRWRTFFSRHSGGRRSIRLCIFFFPFFPNRRPGGPGQEVASAFGITRIVGMRTNLSEGYESVSFSSFFPFSPFFSRVGLLHALKGSFFDTRSAVASPFRPSPRNCSGAPSPS